MTKEEEIVAKAYEDYFNTQVYKESNLHHTYGKVVLNAMKINYNQAIDDACAILRANYISQHIENQLQSLKK